MDEIELLETTLEGQWLTFRAIGLMKGRLEGWFLVTNGVYQEMGFSTEGALRALEKLHG